MKITRLRAQNFRSFDTVDIELGDLNVFIGANASGKSNFLNVLTFLRDIVRGGLEEAVSQGGGTDLVQNVQLPDSERTTDFEVWLDWGEEQSIAHTESPEFKVDTTHYQLKLRNEAPDGFQIARDEFTSQLELLDQGEAFPDEVERTLVVGRKNGRLNIRRGTKFLELAGGATYDHSAIPSNEPLLASSFFPVAFFSETEGLSSFPVFNFNSSDLADSSISGSSKLTEDGSNVALVLRNLLQGDPDRRRTFLNLARALLPFAKDLEVTQFGKSLLLFLQESYEEDTYLPASVLSDGAIKVFALIIALYFDDRPILAFDEPATSLHPKLISQLTQMMREASEEKQIFLTTHNPEVIRHVDLDNIYLVSRDEDGFSQITKPSDSEVVGHFLKNELGIEDLFVDDLLSL